MSKGIAVRQSEGKVKFSNQPTPVAIRSREVLSAILDGSELMRLAHSKGRVSYPTSTSMSEVFTCGDEIRLSFMGDPVLHIAFDRETKEATVARPWSPDLLLALRLDEGILGREQLIELFKSAYESTDFTEYLQHRDEFLEILYLQSSWKRDSKRLEARVGRWGTTDPNSFARGKPFRFIVHGIRDRNPSDIFNHHNEGLLSCSVIDQSHLGTWANAGFILETPEESVVYSNNGDIGPHLDVFGFAGLTALHRGKIHNAHHSANDLLRRTADRGHNEVIVRLTGGNTRIVGGFIVVDINGQPIPMLDAYDSPKERRHALSLFSSVEDLCRKHGLPIVYIRQFSDHLPRLAISKGEHHASLRQAAEAAQRG